MFVVCWQSFVCLLSCNFTFKGQGEWHLICINAAKDIYKNSSLRNFPFLFEMLLVWARFLVSLNKLFFQNILIEVLFLNDTARRLTLVEKKKIDIGNYSIAANSPEIFNHLSPLFLIECDFEFIAKNYPTAIHKKK